MSSVFASNITVSVFGQSHSPAIGVVVDGLPAGHRVSFEELQALLDRRAPGKAPWATQRKEPDIPEILSGLVDGVTCGAPLCAVFRNGDTRSADYREIRDVPRPGHADYTAHVRYSGFQDVAGGGHFSGRLTAPLCFAGGLCMQLLRDRGIFVGAHLLSVGTERESGYDPVRVGHEQFAAVHFADFPTMDREAGERMKRAILAAAQEGDSLGGVVECAVTGLPAGIGSPMFDGMEGRLARLLFAVPAVKGVEFGAGFASAAARGSENNDPFTVKNGQVRTVTNNHGGILGGITSGMPLLLRAAFKPTPSISKAQKSVSLSALEDAELTVHGRHDPCVAVRAVPVIEAVTALGVYDALLDAEGHV